MVFQSLFERDVELWKEFYQKYYFQQYSSNIEVEKDLSTMGSYWTCEAVNKWLDKRFEGQL